MLISYTSTLSLSLLRPNTSSGYPIQKLSPLDLSSKLKEPYCFFMFDNVFSKDVSYTTPGWVFSIGTLFWVFSTASWDVLPSLMISSIFE